jgi:TOBE domain
MRTLLSVDKSRWSDGTFAAGQILCHGARSIYPIGYSDTSRKSGPIDADGDALIARLTRQSIATLQLSHGKRVYAVIKSVAFDSRAIGRGSDMAKSADVEAVVAEDLFSGATRRDHQSADPAPAAD